MRKILLVMLACILALVPLYMPVPVSAAGLDIISRTPAVNAVDVAANSSITVQFSVSINGTTLTENTFNIDGSLSGEISGSFSGGGTENITFNPDADFKVGEIIAVTLTTGLQGTGGETLATPRTWQFVVEAPQPYAYFEDKGELFGGLALNSNGVSLGDLDGDGDLDAFVVNQNQGNKVWLYNSGTGNFTDSGQSLGTNYSLDVALGDLDGDGDLDAFEATAAANKVWRNNGSGTFSDSGQSLGDSVSLGVELGDLDGDGDLDAFVTNTPNPANGGNRVWLNNGSGTFTDSGTYLGEYSSWDVALGDIDDDGDLDAFIANDKYENMVYKNKGGGTFDTYWQDLGGVNRWSFGVALGDLNGDGDLDVFVANINGANLVYLNEYGIGYFDDDSVQTLGTSSSRGVALGDVDGDGDLDAFVANSGANKVWLNNGSGTFSDSGLSLGSSSSVSVALGDIDGDGRLDAFAANYGQVNKVWLNVPVPEIYVEGNSAEIIDGDDSPSADDHTDFGGTDIYAGTVERTFTVNSTGTCPLDLTGTPIVQIGGTHAADFEVTAQPSVQVADGSSTTFQVTFDPSSAGLRTATISIANSDADEDPYNFAIWGNGVDILTVLSTTPVTNALNVAANTNIAVQFNTAINGATVTADTFNVDSSMSGNISGSYSGNGTATITFDPDADFKAGETITVTITTVIEGTAGATLSDPYTWQFVVEAPEGYAYFEDSGQSLGSSSSRGVALGDLDNDGDLDACVANNGSNKVWLYDDASGNFTDSGQALGSAESYAVALGDLDGDGDLDIVAGNNFQNVVYLNDGDGTFPASTNYFGTDTDYTQSVALGDLDGDGDLDIVAGNYDMQSKVYLNDGDGTFATTSHNFGPIGADTYSVALGDLDGDGDLDIVTGNNFQNVAYLGNGDGTFAATGFPFGTGSDVTSSVALGDLDGDGDLDIVVGNWEEQSKVCLNDGDGTFDTTNNLVTSSDSITSVALGDLNGDGRLDVVAGDESQNAAYLGNGDGTFATTSHDFGTSSDYTLSVALGDLNGDGDLDIFIANSSSQPNKVWLNVPYPEMSVEGNSVVIANGDATPSFSDHTDFGITDIYLGTVERTYTIRNSGDDELNLTGMPLVQISGTHAADFDVALQPASPVAPAGSTTFQVTFNPGDVGIRTANISIANDDYNDDPYNFVIRGTGADILTVVSTTPEVNALDVAANTSIAVQFNTTVNGVTVTADTFNVDSSMSGNISGSYSGNGTATITFDPDSDFGVGETITITLTTDIVGTTGGTLSGPYTWQFVVGVPYGYAAFPDGYNFGTGSDGTGSVALGDVDGDGDLDIVVGNWDEQNVLYLNDGGGTFDTTSHNFGGDWTTSIALGDLDSDGDLDIVVGNDSEQNVLHLNDGDGTFDTLSFPFGGDWTSSVALGDMNGDGYLDIAVGNWDEQNVLYLNDGDGTFDTTSFPFGTGSDSTYSVALGDVDGDGDLDIAVGNYNEANRVWLNAAPPPPIVSPTTTGSIPVTNGLQLDLLGTTLSFSGSTIDITSPDGSLNMNIPAGTVAKDKNGNPLENLSVTVDDTPPPPPDDASIIGLAYNFEPDGATFDPPITLTFTYDPAALPEGVAEEDLVLAFYDEETGTWVELECTVDTETNTITALISHFTEFAIVGEVTILPASFSLSNLTVMPAEVEPGEDVTITISVANTGGTRGAFNLILKVDEVDEEIRDVDVAAGEVKTVSFTVSNQEPGTYTIDLNGLEGSYTVIAPVPAPEPAPVTTPPPAEAKKTPPLPSSSTTPAPPPSEPEPATNWLLIGVLAAVGVLVITFLIYRFVNRRD